MVMTDPVHIGYSKKADKSNMHAYAFRKAFDVVIYQMIKSGEAANSSSMSNVLFYQVYLSTPMSGYSFSSSRLILVANLKIRK